MKILRCRSGFWLLLFTLSLPGCANFYDVKADKPATTYYKPQVIDTNFDISGRFFIRQPNKSSYGNFAWHKLNESEELDFNTPLGQTVARINIESGAATLTAKDETYSGDSLDKMMQEQLGFVLPMNYLHFWIQGVSLPDSPVTAELATGFEQLGWKVEYLQWQDKNHPQIIQCTKEDLSIKLFIQW